MTKKRKPLSPAGGQDSTTPPNPVDSGTNGSIQPLPLVVVHDGTESAAATLASYALNPAVQGAQTYPGLNPFSNAVLDPTAILAELGKQAEAVNAGDLSRLEAMLTVQAHTMDAMFNAMARRAELNRGEYPEAFDRYMRLALKAQSQCVRTIETLAEMKNPKPVAFVKQANITAGPQQVNNGPRAWAGKVNPGNEIQEHGHVERLDQGTAGEGIQGDPPMAAVGKDHRPKVGRGKAKGGTKQFQARRV